MRFVARQMARVAAAMLIGATSATGLAAPTPVRETQRIPLSRALAALAQETGAELLVDESLVRDLTVPPLRRRVSIETGLSILLHGTGIGFRRTRDGAYILATAGPRVLAEDDAAVAEILVTGRRTQNADIRRTENDVQPYNVSTSREIEAAHRDNLDQFFRSRVTSNAEFLALGQSALQIPGSPESRVDLRGLGSQRTLVLIDGRRIPGLPSRLIDFDQADVNGVPLGAIDRVETLTGTAGGIYGSGAIGGVVNVILRRDYRGAGLTLTSGITDRGDAARMRLEGRIGFTPDGGATEVMAFGSVSMSERLRYGQRDFDERSRQLAFANDPAGYIAPNGNRFSVPLGNSVLVLSIDGPLVFDPEYGGASLGGDFTYLPLGLPGTDADRRAALLANAGKIDLTPPDDHFGAGRSLFHQADVVAGLFSIRSDLGAGVEAFVDGLYFRNHGEARYSVAPLITATAANAPNNPFGQRVFFRFPSGITTQPQSDSDLLRLVGGIVADLPGSWHGSAEFAFGAAHYEVRESAQSTINGDYSIAMASGLPGSGGRPALFPLGDWTIFQSALPAYLAEDAGTIPITNRFTGATLRLGGPVIRLGSGDLSLNLLAEQRRETIADTDVRLIIGGVPLDLTIQERTQLIRSAYAEVRAPLLPMESDVPLLRGLELQLAMRYDGLRAQIPRDQDPFEDSGELASIHRDAFVYTIGAKAFPLRDLMLRGSYATGRLTPTLAQFQEIANSTIAPSVPDRRRGGRMVTSEGQVDTVTGGSNEIAQEAARTLSIGAVFRPEDPRGPRLSIDYSRISTHGEILPFPLTGGALVLAEDSYPDRVVRAPLTDADRALGFTGGRIVRLDTRAGNFGRRIVDTIDFQLGWRAGEVFGGDLAPYAQATWLPSIRTRSAPGEPWSERTDRADGPIRWRANGGASWTRGPSSIDLNIQYFHSYRVTSSNPVLAAASAQIVRYQGRERISPQAYVDLSGRHRFAIAGAAPLRSIEVRLGILNLFDHSPPILADPNSIGYSAYGDPRRRRVELVVASEF